MGTEEERALNRRAIEAALLRLDTTANALVRACFWEDLSLAEAARRLGLPYEDARYRLKSALGLIAKVLRPRVRGRSPECRTSLSIALTSTSNRTSVPSGAATGSRW